MNATVIVPTYLRPSYLELCLEGLLAQSRLADQVLVVRREDDLGAHVKGDLPEEQT
jgi:GT2 family glycosyltransferase